MQGSRSARVSVWERVSSRRARDPACGARDHAPSGVFLYIKRCSPLSAVHILPPSEYFDTPSSDFYSFLLLFLCFSDVSFCFSSISFCFSAVMDFPHVPEDLGDGLGGGAFSFEDFDLGDTCCVLNTRKRTVVIAV